MLEFACSCKGFKIKDTAEHIKNSGFMLNMCVWYYICNIQQHIGYKYKFSMNTAFLIQSYRFTIKLIQVNRSCIIKDGSVVFEKKKFLIHIFIYAHTITVPCFQHHCYFFILFFAQFLLIDRLIFFRCFHIQYTLNEPNTVQLK